MRSPGRHICAIARRWASRSVQFPRAFTRAKSPPETGRALAERDGGKWLGRPEEEWLRPIREFAVAQMMALIRADLAVLGVEHELFVSERALVERGEIDECLAA